MQLKFIQVIKLGIILAFKPVFKTLGSGMCRFYCTMSPKCHLNHSMQTTPAHTSQPSACLVCCPHSSSGAGSGSAWRPASGWHWPTAQPCVWSLASSSGTPPVVTSRGKARRSRSGSQPVQTQIQGINKRLLKAKRCVLNIWLSSVHCCTKTLRTLECLFKNSTLCTEHSKWIKGNVFLVGGVVLQQGL